MTIDLRTKAQNWCLSWDWQRMIKLTRLNSEDIKFGLYKFDTRKG